MKIRFDLSRLSPSLFYGLLNALAGLIVGFYVYFLAIGDGYEIFMLAAPPAMFGIGFLVWHVTMKGEEIRVGRMIFLGVIVGTVSHYFTWVLVSVFMNLCYWCTGGCTDSFGEAPASISGMLGYGMVYSFFSILFFGWLTILCSVLCGIVMMWMKRTG